MAIAKRRLTPKPPPFDTLDRTKVKVEYEPDEDTLFVHLLGGPQPAISKYVDDDTIYRLDPVTEAVVGVEVENFLANLLAKTEPNADPS
ncbi:MAG: DUF2283 domain-containing protein [Chloroflexota bacterium]|nr:DUF2283 domain-containing protein [Chloroflexota bacterium]